MLRNRIPGGDFEDEMTFSHYATASGLRVKAGSTSGAVRWQRAFSLSPEAQGLCAAIAGGDKVRPCGADWFAGQRPVRQRSRYAVERLGYFGASNGEALLSAFKKQITSRKTNSPPAATEPD